MAPWAPSARGATHPVLDASVSALLVQYGNEWEAVEGLYAGAAARCADCGSCAADHRKSSKHRRTGGPAERRGGGAGASGELVYLLGRAREIEQSFALVILGCSTARPNVVSGQSVAKVGGRQGRVVT